MPSFGIIPALVGAGVIMKLFKSLSILGIVALVSACGSSNQPASTFSNGYAQTGVYPNTVTPNGQGTYNQLCGSKLGTQVLGGVVYTYGTYNLSQTAQVSAGDVVIVQAQGAIVQSTSSTFIPVSTSCALSGLRVKLNGATIGSGSAAQYNITQTGTLTFEGEWWAGGSSGTHSINFNGGGVMVCH